MPPGFIPENKPHYCELGKTDPARLITEEAMESKCDE
jgi:hypothetical protein